MLVLQVQSVLVFMSTVHLCERVESIAEEGGVGRLDSVVQLVTQMMFSVNNCTI